MTRAEVLAWVSGVDFLDPELFRANPHELWSAMREHAPHHVDEPNELLVLTRYADVSDVERRASIFISSEGYRKIWDPAERDMIALDGDEHWTQRDLVKGGFTRRSVAGHEDMVAGIVDDLVAGFAAGGDVDIVGALSAPLPARVTSRLLGYPDDLWPVLKEWSEQLMRLDVRDTDDQAAAGFLSANHGMLDLVRQATDAPRCPVSSGVMRTWRDAVDVGVIDRATMLHEMGLFVSGGSETTRTALSHGVRLFCDRADLWNRLAENPVELTTAVDELLRWVTPINNFFRRSASDTTIAGVPVRRGQRVMLVYPSANRDSTVFADPDEFDIRRSPNPHLAFGLGPHRCLGEHVARLELRIALGRLTARFEPPTVVTEPDVEPNLFVRAVRSFVVNLRPRTTR